MTITQIIATNNPPVAGQPATATVQLVFGRPLPDDRYTISIKASSFLDPADNMLDGESNAVEPLGIPTFPSGNGGAGNFVARFTVDSRPHIGIFGNGIQQLDINGNGIWDPVNAKDATNSDKSFNFGFYTDNLFAGNFAPAGQNGNGFDKLGAYGVINGQFRFLLATAGVTDSVISVIPSLQINGLPVAYKFNPAINADEIAVFDGNGNWYIDYGHDNTLGGAGTIVVHDGLRGYPVVGDFDGSGHFELATYQPDTNIWQFDLTPLTNPGVTTTLSFGFPGVQERPVAADMNQDGITDIGLYVPTSLTSALNPGDNWYFLISQGTPVVGTINTLNHPFSPLDNPLDPTPPATGNDVYYNFGNGFFQPIVGIWDPPGSPTASTPVSAPPGATGGPSGTIDNLQPTFSWNAVSGVSSYEVWLTDQTTGQTVTPVVSGGTSWTPAQPLNLGDNYIWWVGSINTDGSISWNNPSTFNFAPNASTLSGNVATLQPIFTWNAMNGVGSYEVWLTDQTTGQTVTPIVTGNSWSPAQPLNLGDNYIWWVGAVGSNGKVAWNIGQAFTIASAANNLSGIISTLLPSFTWNPVVGISTYEVWLTDQTTGKTVTPIVAGSSWMPALPLTVGDKYTWWVGAIDPNNSNKIAWNTGQTFTVGVTANTLSGTIATNQPSFTWSAVTGVTSYEITGLPIKPPRRHVTPMVTTGTSWTPAQPLTFGDNYIWWVGAVDPNNNAKIAWSAGQSFTIAPTATGPSGAQTTASPVFSWNTR